jgi:hypothetical protein
VFTGDARKHGVERTSHADGQNRCAVLTGLAVLGKAPLIGEIVPANAGVIYGLCGVSCLMPLLYRQFLKVSRSWRCRSSWRCD